uniref:glycosyltransferase n=1 Tax=Ornithinicoccus halotolerans TaxID=1748220 RepID=UPI0012961D5A
MTAPPGARARSRRRAPVEDVTVLVLTRPGGPLIDPLLDALAAQTRLPARVVLTGLDPDEDEVARARSHPLVSTHGAELVVADRQQPAARADEAAAPAWSRVVDRALAGLPVGPATWVWVLHDDSDPEPTALERLVAAVRQSSDVGAVGPKLVDAEAPRRLVGVGLTTTRAGRPTGEEVTGLVDQGQLDRRRDVLGVPLAGLLVRAEVLAEVGGMDRVGDGGAEGLDLSWRCHLAGHRVLVAPAAVVRQGAGSQPSRWRRRLATRHVALAREAWWWVPLRAAGVLLTSVLAAVLLLLVKRPREAALEWADVVAVLTPWRRVGARWRFRGRRRVRRRDLQTLFDRPAAGWLSTVDTVQEAVTPGASRRAAAGPVGSRETGPVDEDAQSLEVPDRRRVSTVPWVLLAVVAAVAAVRWREHWGALAGSGRGLSGTELPGSLAAATSSATWHALRD